MSYDYNALVSTIASSRQAAAAVKDNENEKWTHLQTAVDTFATLSSHCPMTPLLWMQYASDTARLLQGMTQDSHGANETRLQLLELALAEFPGSAILQIHYLELLFQSFSTSSLSSSSPVDALQQKMEAALLAALESIGAGSHRNEGVLVVKVYQLAVKFYTSIGHKQKALHLFAARSRVPLKDVNQSLTQEALDYCQNHQVSQDQTQDLLQAIDEGRRYESRSYAAIIISHEDEVDLAMHAEGILPRHQVDLDALNWETILQPTSTSTCWLGYGGMQTATAFQKYAHTCYRYKPAQKKPENSEDADEKMGDDENDQNQKEAEDLQATIRKLALSVFERGVAECPTVETIWLAYIRHLTYLTYSNPALIGRLQSVMNRSIRNCPYSLQLYLQKLNLPSSLAERGLAILDPDDLQTIVKEALEPKFLTAKESCLSLQMEVVRIVRRRILFLLAKAPILNSTQNKSSSESKTLSYFEAEPVSPTVIHAGLDDSTTQELEDLSDDLREIYDTIDAYLRKHHSSWAEARAHLWADRAFTETNLLGPLTASLNDDEDDEAGGARSKNTLLKETIRCYEKLSKVFNPTHPDVYIDYIANFQKAFACNSPASVISRIRQTRFLFERAIKSVGKPKMPTNPVDHVLNRDVESSLRSLCHQYLVFERYLGTDKNVTNASALVQKKLEKLATAAAKAAKIAAKTSKTPTTTTEKKETMEVDEAEQEPSSKKRKLEDNTDAKKIKVVHKVKVGDKELPAHPYTIRVSHLHASTEEMDLVDAFRPTCGAVVHVKISRDKHQKAHGKGKSKGWGLVQFESPDSVETALELNGTSKIHDKLVTIERSHFAAVSLVPPGMHRVNPKGEGRSSKQNSKRKYLKVRAKIDETKEDRNTTDGEHTGDTGKEKSAASGDAKPSPSGAGISVLAFRPRGVRKPKVALGTKTGSSGGASS